MAHTVVISAEQISQSSPAHCHVAFGYIDSGSLDNDMSSRQAFAIWLPQLKALIELDHSIASLNYHT